MRLGSGRAGGRSGTSWPMGDAARRCRTSSAPLQTLEGECRLRKTQSEASEWEIWERREREEEREAEEGAAGEFGAERSHHCSCLRALFHGIRI